MKEETRDPRPVPLSLGDIAELETNDAMHRPWMNVEATGGPMPRWPLLEPGTSSNWVSREEYSRVCEEKEVAESRAMAVIWVLFAVAVGGWIFAVKP